MTGSSKFGGCAPRQAVTDSEPTVGSISGGGIRDSNGVGRMSVATFNCRTSSGELRNILGYFAELGVDVVVLQETRITRKSFASVRKLAQTLGYSSIWVPARATPFCQSIRCGESQS